MRYERKYKLDHFSDHLLAQAIRLHPAGFRKIFPDRQVNNIYFDTADWTTYKENVMGIAERKKFRIRWYGEKLQEAGQPIFETKIKSNLLGDKISQPFPPFLLEDLDFITIELQKLARTEVPLFPTLLNSYQRSYFGTPDGNFRLTIDRDLKYFSLFLQKKFRQYQLEEEGVVLELKYDEGLDGKTDWITQHFPFQMTKSSKYVTGVTMTSGLF